MPDPRLAIDANGVVTTPGRFQGRHIDEVMTYFEAVEAAVNSSRTPGEDPPPVTPPVRELTPAEKLAAANAERMTPIQQMTLTRLEQDDEAAFAATVKDYDKYKETIDKLKANIAPHLRAQKDLHRTLYINVKTNDPKMRERLYAPADEPPAVPPVGDEPPPPSPGVETPPPVAAPPAPVPFRPKAAPPMAAPTPASRPAPAATTPKREPKLVANDKIKAFCRATGADVKEYLLRLEDQGQTQEMLDNAGQLGKREQPRSVYDRTRAKTRA